MANLVWRLLVIVISKPVSSVVREVAEKAWAATRPGDPPRTPADPHARWLDSIIWAALTAISLTVGQLIATRGAGELWRLFGGGETPQQRRLRKQAEQAEQADTRAATRAARKAADRSWRARAKAFANG